MLEIKDKKLCTGCAVCVSACPQKIISMNEDYEGFMYPSVDSPKCLECGLCNRICPMLDRHHGVPDKNSQHEKSFYSAQLLSASDLDDVSSGGAFWAFAQYIIHVGGIVYGAAQFDVDTIKHIRVDNIEDAKKIRRSKYFQSSMGDIYALVKKDLKEQKTVLFSGTGCQIAALNMYLGKYRGKLFTCEVVCHGVPSMKAWRSYRYEHEEYEERRITDLVFRDKSNGWSRNQYKVTYSDGAVVKERSAEHLFHAGYLQGLFYRPSCGECPFAAMPRTADITLADYWKYAGAKFRGTKEKGVSLISVNSREGQYLLDKSSSYLDIEPTSEKEALASCKHMDEHPSENPDRKKFFELLEREGYHSAARKYITRRKENIIRKIFKRIGGKPHDISTR